MGGELRDAPAGAAPHFLIRATRGPIAHNLDRIQIIKGWTDASGQAREKIFNVAWSDDHQLDNGGKLAAVGNTANTRTGKTANTIGAAELATVWLDPEFDPVQSAFYYARVLQIPTVRHSQLDAIAMGMDTPYEGPATIQERAYTSTGSMSFADFPFEPGGPTYPNARQMLQYFQRYADHFRVCEHIHFGSRVIGALPLADGSWTLELANGQVREYSSVVVATGQYTSPRRPHAAIPGHFSGEHLHVFDYLDATMPIDLRDKRVIVVGVGSSAAELTAELCNPEAPAGCASQLILSARSGRWVLPKLRGGKPLDARSPHPAARLPALLRALPVICSFYVEELRRAARGL
jgi:hypothetical protein